MSYQIDSGIWSSVFAVPTAVVDKHIKMCSPLSLKILLVMLRHSGTPVDAQWLSEQLNISPADISDAFGYWVGAGIVTDSDRPAQRPAESASVATAAAPAPVPAAVQETQNETTGQKILTISSRPKISQQDVVTMANADRSIAQLLIEAQSILGVPLTPVESEALVALCTYYGMKFDVVLMLLQYCVSIGKRSMSYVEKTAAAWMEKGLCSHEQVEREIVRLTQNNEQENKIVKAFGLYSRSLTTKEREFVSRWFGLGMEEKMIFLACERSVENTGKASFAYADKIITSWKSKGVNTIKAAIEELNSGKRSADAKPNKSAQTGGDSSIDMDKMHELLHQQFRD